MASGSGPTVRAERTPDEVILRLPSPSRFLRAFLPDDAVKHLMAAQRAQLLAVRAEGVHRLAVDHPHRSRGARRRPPGPPSDGNHRRVGRYAFARSRVRAFLARISA